MKFNSKEEFAKAIIDAGEDGLTHCNRHVFFNATHTHPFRSKGNNVPMLGNDWDSYNRDWQPYIKPIPDKSLVWCWDNNWNTMRSLRVYDANNKSVFHTSGTRGEFVVPHANHQQLTEDEIQPWMQELIDNCEE